jgi:dATP/dGTP diphosphohydrolase
MNTTNGSGANQSELYHRLILADPSALRALGGVLASGAKKYGRSNVGEGWYTISAEDHIDHALDHILLWRLGNIREDHLAHAQCRVHMALAVDSRKKLKELSERDWS